MHEPHAQHFTATHSYLSIWLDDVRALCDLSVCHVTTRVRQTTKTQSFLSCRPQRKPPISTTLPPLRTVKIVVPCMPESDANCRRAVCVANVRNLFNI